jgi:pimeloyl-ACP methyl ester carboxylesterase
MPTWKTSHGAISYTDFGEGPPTLLLHAALHDSTDYAPVYDTLSSGRRVLSVDWPSHGASAALPQPLGAPEMGALAIEFVDALDLKNLVVVGNSVGGYAACRIALERPERVSGIVLVNTGGFTPHTPFSRAFCAAMGRPAFARSIFPLFVRAYMKPKTDDDRRIAARVLARAKTREGARTAAALWRSFTRPAHDLRKAGRDIAAPVLITWGTKDLTAPTSWGRAVADAIPGARLTTLPTGHVVFSSDPAGWLREVVPFLDEAHHAERPATRG